MLVQVRDNNVDQALKALKKKMQREGIFREMKLRNYYEKPYWKGQTLQECADEIQVPLGTVKTRVRLALARLRELLGGRSDE